MINKPYCQNDRGKDSMKNRRKILIWGCLSMVCLLTACYKGDGTKDGTVLTEDASVEMLETRQESIPENLAKPETETVMETGIKTSETMPEISVGAGIMAEVDEIGENDKTDQDEFTWLDRALAEVLEKNMGELKETDYMAIKSLTIYGGNIQDICYPQNNIVKFVIRGKRGMSIVPFENSLYDVIDMQDIAKCSNLEYLEIALDYMTHPETYIIHYDELIKLKKLESLEILLNGNDSSFSEIVDQIDDLSFVCDMPNLTSLTLKNIDLPDDLSPLFSHSFQKIVLSNCNITEEDFFDLGDDVLYPRRLDLPWNQIKDATVLTAMQTKLLSGTPNAVYCLCLGENPLEKLGDYLTEERLMQCEESIGGISLSLHGTDFEEYSFGWFTDTD